MTKESSNISEIIESTGAVIFLDTETGSLITWNGSATFNWWRAYGYTNEWLNVDVKTVYDITTLRQAEAVAKEWMDDFLEGLEH